MSIHRNTRDRIEIMLADMVEEYDGVTADRDYYHDQVDRLEKEIESLEDDLAKAYDTIESLESVIEDLEDKIREYRGESIASWLCE